MPDPDGEIERAMAQARPALPPRRSAFGARPPSGVEAKGAILRVEGLVDSASKTVMRDGTIDLLRIGPDTWYAVSRREPDDVREAVLAAAGTPVACTDLTHARVVLRVAGPDAQRRLSRGCPMDLDSVEPGHTVATMLGPFEVLIRRGGEPDAFDVFVPRSVARSARAWLLGAGSPDEPAP